MPNPANRPQNDPAPSLQVRREWLESVYDDSRRLATRLLVGATWADFDDVDPQAVAFEAAHRAAKECRQTVGALLASARFLEEERQERALQRLRP